VTCDENYEFPDSQLLLDGEVKHLKNLRGIFKSKSKTEIMNLQFGDDILAFKGEINNKLGYEIKTQNLSHYGNYLSAEADKPSQFSVALSLRHILSMIKIAEMIEGNVRLTALIIIVHGSNGALGC
jgi:predicted hotdog family 3-hydroxylacyl-ACP dehydratase